MQPELLLQPRRTALLQGHDNTLDVLVRLQAPLTPPPGRRERPPLNLAIVLDRSGSMGGRPMAEAVRCAGFMIDGLGPQDRASLVIYDDKVDVLVPSTPVTDRARFHRALQGVTSRGSTALHGGWLAGAEQVAAHLRPDLISRVLLISDGNANHGLTDTAEIVKQCGALAASGVTTSTYGLAQRFNEELMGEMARAGGGNGYYGQTADDLMDPFREEFDLLAALYARRVQLSLTPAAGVSLEVRNGYPQTASGAWLLPDLAYGGEAWALAHLRIPRAALLTAAPVVSLLSAQAALVGMDGEAIETPTVRLQLPTLPAAAFGAVAEDELVRRRAQELEAARYQEQARVAALAGEWERVQALLEEARTRAADNEWVRQSLDVLEGYARRRERDAFSKEAYFKSSKMRQRLTSQTETAWGEDSNEEATYLRRKIEQGRRED